MKLGFSHNIPLTDTIQFEKEFVANLQCSLNDKIILKELGAEFIYLLD